MAPPTSSRRTPFHRVAAAITVACAVLALPVTAALAATDAPGQATRTPSAAPRCGFAHPQLPGGAFVWSSSVGDGFAGGAGYEVEITNVGQHPCTLKGVPGVAAVRSNGHIVGTRVPGSSNGPLITLQPRATAHVGLTVHDAGAICGHPVSAKVIRYLSGHKTAQDTFLTALACPGKPGGGVLSVSVIKAGTGIPLYDI
jgi:hypothetical protein